MSHVRRFGRLLLPLLVAALAVVADGPALGLPVPTALAATTSSSFSDDLMLVTNLDRAAFGLPALTVDPTLASFALDAPFACPSNASMTLLGRADDMATRDYFAHTIAGCSKPDGTLYTSLDIVYLTFGYNTNRGENIAWNTYPTSDATYQSGCDINGNNCVGATAIVPSTVAVAERGFMMSSGHRANILGTYDRFGCAAAYGSTGWYYACVFSLGGPALQPAPAVSYGPSTYTPLDPTRILDTRTGNGLGGPLTAGAARTLQVAGRGGVPASAVAITGNLTVTGPTAGGYVTLAPSIAGTPQTSTVNFPVGDTRANGVSVPLATDGTVALYYASGTAGARVQAILDVTGYYVAGTGGARFVALAPSRIVDTRVGLGVGSALVAGSPATFQVAGQGGVPAGALAITGNVTVTAASARAYVALTTTATASPSTSTINLPTNDTRANNVTVRLGTGGTLGAVLMSGTTGSTAQLIVDVTGYYVAGSTGAMYIPLTPTRIVDTRRGLGLPSALASGSPGTFGVAGQGGVPSDAAAVTGNVTMTGQTSNGYIAITPLPTTTPPVSNVNAPVGDTRANGVAAQVGSGGSVAAVYRAVATGRSALVVDVTGYFR